MAADQTSSVSLLSDSRESSETRVTHWRGHEVRGPGRIEHASLVTWPPRPPTLRACRAAWSSATLTSTGSGLSAWRITGSPTRHCQLEAWGSLRGGGAGPPLGAPTAGGHLTWTRRSGHSTNAAGTHLPGSRNPSLSPTARSAVLWGSSLTQDACYLLSQNSGHVGNSKTPMHRFHHKSLWVSAKQRKLELLYLASNFWEAQEF